MTNRKPDRPGIVLFGHGARNSAWSLPMQHIAERMRSKTHVPIVLSFLEFLSPNLDAACEQLVAAGVDRIIVIPVFLAGAGHLVNDLPGLLGSIRSRFPLVTIEQQSALGDRPEVLDALSESFLAHLSSCDVSS